MLSLLLLSLAVTGCGVLFPWPGGNYPMTSFYVKNDSDKAIDFQATVMKHSTAGPFEMTVPFTVQPQDSVLARQVGFRKDVAPKQWFVRFRISPVEGVQINDPYRSENWKKGIDSKGKPIYTFTVAE